MASIVTCSAACYDESMGLFDDIFGDIAADLKEVGSDLATIKDDVVSSTDFEREAIDLQNDITGQAQESESTQDETQA